MPRRPRIHRPGRPLHIVQRGHNCEACFFCEEDYRSYRRTGPLWDSRYQSSLIHAGSYLLACMRYIERNPVRAALVDDPAHYRCTSYRTNGLGQGSSRVDARLVSHSVYLALGARDAARRKTYRELFRSALDAAAVDDIRLALNQNQPLGDKRFYARVARSAGERHQARPRGRPRAVKTAAA